MQDALAPATDRADRLMRELALDPARLKTSHDAWQRYAVPTTGMAAGWHGPGDIATLEGLAGDYLWTEQWFQAAKLSLRFDRGHAGSQGTYALASLLAPPEQGVFHCVPNNPAMGWAFVSLVPRGGSARTFTVAGILTDAAWKIGVLLLNRLGPDGPLAPPFSALRVGDAPA